MRITTTCITFLLLLTGCEKVVVYEARVDGDGVTPLTEYQPPGTPPREWTIERDDYRVFAAAQVGRGRLHLYVRTQTDPETTEAAQFWSLGALPLTVNVDTDCQSSSAHFDNPGNSYANNFLKADYPEIHPHSPAIEAPGLSAILIVEPCDDTEMEVRISVLDAAGEPLREHLLSVRIEEVDWYYNPLWP